MAGWPSVLMPTVPCSRIVVPGSMPVMWVRP